MHNLQAQILRQAAVLLRTEGRLAYITCSLLSSENDRQIDGFLRENHAFEPLVTVGPTGLQARHMLHPCNGDTDGLYIAMLKRRAAGYGA